MLSSGSISKADGSLGVRIINHKPSRRGLRPSNGGIHQFVFSQLPWAFFANNFGCLTHSNGAFSNRPMFRIATYLDYSNPVPSISGDHVRCHPHQDTSQSGCSAARRAVNQEPFLRLGHRHHLVSLPNRGRTMAIPTPEKFPMSGGGEARGGAF